MTVLLVSLDERCWHNLQKDKMTKNNRKDDCFKFDMFFT